MKKSMKVIEWFVAISNYHHVLFYPAITGSFHGVLVTAQSDGNTADIEQD